MAMFSVVNQPVSAHFRSNIFSITVDTENIGKQPRIQLFSVSTAHLFNYFHQLFAIIIQVRNSLTMDQNSAVDLAARLQAKTEMSGTRPVISLNIKI